MNADMPPARLPPIQTPHEDNAMKKILVLAIAAALIPATAALAGPPAPKKAGIEAKELQVERRRKARRSRRSS